MEMLLELGEQVKKDGNVLAVKLDGGRDMLPYTIFIAFPKGGHEIIRFDSENLKQGLFDCLHEYFRITRFNS